MRIIVYYLLSFLLVFFIAGCQKGIDKIYDIGTIDSTKNYDSLFTVSVNNVDDTGEILLDFNTKTTGVLAILDQSGNVIKTKNTALRVDNFQKWNINGTVRYTYFQTDGSYTIDSIPG